MAPWPEHESEPKAPDKSADKSGDKQYEGAGERPRSSKCESGEETDTGIAGASKQVEDRNPGVSQLDDIQLRKLLDEAITYKCPRDREGKSELFRELLQEAEADESEHTGSQRGGSVSSSSGGGRYRRSNTRKGDVSERNSRGGSLQNLVYALNSDLDVHAGLGFGRKRGGRRNLQPQVSVSARQREGGSLPCNVNADYTAAALLRTHDDISTGATSSKRREAHTTPIDDVVTGNSYSYKLNSVKCNSVTVDDLASYRVGGSGKRAAGSVDDIVTAVPRGSGNKRKELKKLGHSSDDIYTGASTSDDIHLVEEFRKQENHSQSEDIKNDATEFSDADSPELRGQMPNNVDAGRSDHTVIDIDLRGRRNCPPMLGMNGMVRPGTDRRWTKSESRKDDDLEGMEMVSMDRNSDIIKYTAVCPSEHNGVMDEVDQPIDFLLNKGRTMSNGERLLPLNSSYRSVESLVGPQHDLSAGDSVRGTTDTLGDAALGSDKSCPTRLRDAPYCVLSQWKAPVDKDMRFLRVETPYRNLSLQQFLGGAKEPSEKKSYDENGNSLHQLHNSNSDRKYKPRKVKTDKNPYIMSQAIPGHRGDFKDINELLQFIESDSPDAKASLGGKNTRNANGPINLSKDNKQRNNSSSGKRSEDGPQKLRSEKRKSGEKNKLKKSNSLEEISRTKLSDLTAADSGSVSKGVDRRPKKQSTLDDADLVGSSSESTRKTSRSGGGGDRRSWGPDDSTQQSEDDTSSRSRKRKGADREDRGRGRGSGSGSGSGSSSRKQRDGVTQQHPHIQSAEPCEVQNTAVAHSGDVVVGDPAEFHVVTKKQRKKKSGRSSSIGRNERAQHHSQTSAYYGRDGHSRRSGGVDGNDNSVLYQYRSVQYRGDSPDHGQHQRRKSTSSMPPSDKSADSSDLDSVHSLPISSTTPRTTVDKTSTSSGSTPQASYADIARMASSMSPPQGQSFIQGLSQGSSVGGSQGTSPVTSPGSASSPSQTKSSPPLWTANVTLHTATPLPPSQEEGDPNATSPTAPIAVATLSSSVSGNLAKRDAMTNTVSPVESEPEPTDSSPVGNLLSDNCYPPLRDSGKSPLAVTQCVKTFISQVSRTSPAISHGVTMANCVDVEDSAKRAASPAFDCARESGRTTVADRPAVIILDEAETEASVDGDPELTFGFEINEMLLSGACEPSSGEEDEESLVAVPASTKAQSSITVIPNINLDKIVAFVGRAWEDVMKELPCEAGRGGRVQYYSGQ